MTPELPSPHQWGWSLFVENQFRNSTGRIDYRHYGPQAVYREAVWAAGPTRANLTPGAAIRIHLQGEVLGLWTDREDAGSTPERRCGCFFTQFSASKKERNECEVPMYEDLCHKFVPGKTDTCRFGCLVPLNLNNYNNFCPERVEELRQAYKNSVKAVPPLPCVVGALLLRGDGYVCLLTPKSGRYGFPCRELEAGQSSREAAAAIVSEQWGCPGHADSVVAHRFGCLTEDGGGTAPAWYSIVLHQVFLDADPATADWTGTEWVPTSGLTSSLHPVWMKLLKEALNNLPYIYTHKEQK